MVDILFQCGDCGKHVCVNGALVGKAFRCPDCGCKIRAPEPSFVFYCPSCLAQFSAPDGLKNSDYLCPGCEHVIHIPECTTILCRECSVIIEIDTADYLEFEGKDILCPECRADVAIPAKPHVSELTVDETSGRNMPPGFGSKTLRLDEIIDNIPQADQLRKGRCPYCARPIWRMDQKSFACRNCGRLIQTITPRVSR